MSDNTETQTGTIIRITESTELPISSGLLEVDTSNGGVTIFMKSVREHSDYEKLTITKISRDNNMVSLFSDTCLINKAEIIMFGLPTYAKVKKGKVKSIVLKCDGVNWDIIHEE